MGRKTARSRAGRIAAPADPRSCIKNRQCPLSPLGGLCPKPHRSGFLAGAAAGGVGHLYLDEFGHTGRWIPNDPRFGHHPFFGLAGFAIPGDRWADLDRQFYRLKCDLYKKELAQFVISKGERPERFEPKQLKSRRDLVFAAEVFNLVNRNQGHLFAYGYHKNVDFHQHRDHAIYIGCVLNSMLNYEKYLKDRAGRKAGQGLIIMDRRNDALNSVVTTAFRWPTCLAGPWRRSISTGWACRGAWRSSKPSWAPSWMLSATQKRPGGPST